MKFIAVIPARYGSTRFPAKPLALLKGKPIIQWVVEAAKQNKDFTKVFVATDHPEIASVVKEVNGEVLMTTSDCPTGTDRIFEATKNLDLDFDVVVNIQGDEPMVNNSYLQPLIQAFQENPKLDMATLSHPIHSMDELENKNAVKVIKNQFGEAIYFSRFPIPYSRIHFDFSNEANFPICEKHIGLYGYSRRFLKIFCQTHPAKLELAESLEQLRALHMGAKIKVMSVAKPIQGVDTLQDLERLEKLSVSEIKGL